MPLNPFELLHRDLERISRALRPGRLPVTVPLAGRIFMIAYTSIKEAKAEPGIHLAGVQVAEVDKGVVGGTTLVLNPKEQVARIDWASVALRRIGLGKAMIQAIERDLGARGYLLIELNAVPASIGFWKSLGYLPQAEEIPGQSLEMAKKI